MSRFCQICGRGPKAATSRSHSNIATKRTLAINLQTKKVARRRVKICSKCLKSQGKNK